MAEWSTVVVAGDDSRKVEMAESRSKLWDSRKKKASDLKAQVILTKLLIKAAATMEELELSL